MNGNKNLSNKNILRFYDFLLEYENNIRSKYGSFDINDNAILQFLNNNGIFFGSVNNEKDKNKSKKFNNYILWKEGTNSKKKTNVDRAHALLRRIRNAFAHGNLHERKNGTFEIFDYEKNKENKMTMHGIISQHLLYELINRLKYQL